VSSLRARAALIAFRVRHPQTTVRWRLTLMYGALFFASGAVLLAITYTLVSHSTITPTNIKLPFRAQIVVPPPSALATNGPRQNFTRVTSRQVRQTLHSRAGRALAVLVGSHQRISDLHELVIESVIALAIMALLGTALGWIIAGRVLRPLRTMTATTQQISAASLDQRLDLQGPPDELRKLGDTIDGLLERLEASFDAQRRFVANASHELRTPLTAARALLEMVLSDPDATMDTFRETCQQVLEEGEQQEQLIAALLALAQGQRGVERRDLVDLAVVSSSVVEAHEIEAVTRGVSLDVWLTPAPLTGDRRLIERLVSNLLENALRHNVPGGRVRLEVKPLGVDATLMIANTGPRVPADQVERLLQPFQRLAQDRVGHRDGLGLGLSIVSAIAAAHDATLAVEPGADGGLQIEVRFPRVPDSFPRPSESVDAHGESEQRPAVKHPM